VDAGWLWGRDGQPLVGVSEAVVVDAAGATFAVDLEPTDGGFAIRLPAAKLEGVRYPLVVDPVVFDARKLDGAPLSGRPVSLDYLSVAYNGTVALAAWRAETG